MSAGMDLERFLAESRARIEAHLDGVLPAAAAPPRPLHAAMRDAVLAGGKRLRPALAFAGALACGGEPEQALPVAAAAELAHVHSLVHDDLPALDDDAERRGRPTVHVRHGEALAILAGDALLAEAFGCLGRAGVPATLVARLARAAGSRGVAGGQADDVAFRVPDGAGARDRAGAELTSIHERKTAALFDFSVVGGAVLGGATAADVAPLERFARHFGLAYQLRDDLQDADPDECSALAVWSPGEIEVRLSSCASRALEALGSFGEKGLLLRALGERLLLAGGGPERARPGGHG